MIKKEDKLMKMLSLNFLKFYGNAKNLQVHEYIILNGINTI